jgi:hypothetical protein
MNGSTGASQTGELQSMLARALNMVVKPREEWMRIAGEPTSIASLYVAYALPMLGFVAIVSFLQRALIGTWVPLAGTVKAAPSVALESVVASLLFGLIGLFLLALIIQLLAPAFGAKRDLRQAVKTAVYSATPACVASVFSFLPLLGTLIGLILMLYGIYVLYLGLIPVMSTPKEGAAGYTATVVIVTILLSFLVGMLGVARMGIGRGADFSALPRSQTPVERQHAGAEAAGNAIGNLLGTDRQGKAQLGEAIENLAKAGARADQAPATSTGSDATSADSSAGSADPTPNTAAAATGLLTALGGALGGSRRADPVDFNTLKGFLPQSLPGLQRDTARGSNQQALGVKSASANAVYSGSGDRKVEVSIADASGVSGLLDLASALPQTTSSSSDIGIETDATVAGYSAHEKFDSRAQHGEISFILAKRFAVELVGDHVDLSTLEQYAGNLDLARLVAMKDAGAHSN